MADAKGATGGSARRASPKVLIAVAAVVAAAVIVGIVFAMKGGSSESTSTTAPAGGTGATPAVAPLPHAAEVGTLLGGIQQQGNQLGDPNAPVAMIEYVDIQCPYCAQFENEAMPPLIRKYIRTGKVFLESRPIASLGDDSQRGRLALVAAGLQGKFFQLAHLLYLNQGEENSGWLTDKVLRQAAAGIDGLDARQLFQDMNSSTAVRQGSIFDDEARAAAIQVTPTIYVGKNGGTLHQVTPAFPGDDATIAKSIEAALSS